jgi:predicted metal-dependent peptidase
MAVGKYDNYMAVEALTALDETHPYWMGRVLDIGQPIMDRSIATACIAIEGDDFVFRMNPDFARSLTPNERAFLMSHEAMHVIRGDLKAWKSGRYSDLQVLNVAMDAIINDTLANAGLVCPSSAVRGVPTVGYDCEGADLDEVYEAVKRKKDGEPEPEPSDEGEEGEGEGDGTHSKNPPVAGDDEDGEGDGEGEDDGEGAEGEGDDAEGDTEGESGDESDDAEDEGVDGTDPAKTGKPMSGGGHDDWSEEMAEKSEAVRRDDRDRESKAAGDGDVEGEPTHEEAVAQEVRRLDDLNHLDFEKLFRLVEPELVDGFGRAPVARADWRRPRREMMGMYPKVMLPARRDNNAKLQVASRRMQLVVFLDNSGSVSHRDVALFREIAKRLPKAKADYVFVCAGSTAHEVSHEELVDDTKRLPYVGSGATISEGRKWKKGNAYAKDGWEDAARTSQLLTDKRRTASADGYVTEFDAMQAWLMQAVQTGRLRSYPKSVLVISDAQSVLTMATPEQASRWTVITNSELHSDGSWPTMLGGVAGTKRKSAAVRRSSFLANCILPVGNIHRLRDFIHASHMRGRRARV